MQRMNLRVTSVVGHGKTGSEAAGMKVNQQKRILEEIKQYKYQVLGFTLAWKIFSSSLLGHTQGCNHKILSYLLKVQK